MQCVPILKFSSIHFFIDLFYSNCCFYGGMCFYEYTVKSTQRVWRFVFPLPSTSYKGRNNIEDKNRSCRQIILLYSLQSDRYRMFEGYAALMVTAKRDCNVYLSYLPKKLAWNSLFFCCLPLETWPHSLHCPRSVREEVVVWTCSDWPDIHKRLLVVIFFWDERVCLRTKSWRQPMMHRVFAACVLWMLCWRVTVQKESDFSLAKIFHAIFWIVSIIQR